MHIKVLIGWHVDQGSFAETALDGLNAALFAYTPGHMLQTKWKVALYVDERADAQQQDALGKIFSGAAGGHLAALVPLIGEVLGVERAAIDYRLEGRHRSLTIPQVAQMEIEALAGQGGEEVTLSNVPFAVVPDYPAVVCQSKRLSFHDHGFDMEISKKNGFYSPSATRLEGRHGPRAVGAVVAAALAGITALAWGYLGYQSWAMDHMDVVDMAMLGTQRWGPWDLLLVFTMWSVMMIGMMTPSAGPVVLLFSRIQNGRHAQGRPVVASGLFLLGYLGAWTGFSLAVTLVQWGMHAATLSSPAMADIRPLLGGAVLIAAGAYQWTPAKHACLAHCRSPMGFLLGEWRDGAMGAFVMGLRHGLYCTGCCWLLMLVLFVVGVMNLLWIALLAALVLLEKTLQQGPGLSRIAGLALIAWGGWIARGALA